MPFTISTNKFCHYLYKFLTIRYITKCTFQDRTKLVYCDAVLLESLRMTTIFTVVGGRTNIKDVTLCGYHIPK